MIHNKYYIVNASDPNLSDIEAVIVGQPDTQRYSINGSQIVVKLHKGDSSAYPFLADYQEENHEQILISMNTPEWVHPIP